jgi:hypothetical protein
MLELVTVEEAIDHIRGDEDADEAWLEVFIPAVSEAVRLWLKDNWRLYVPMRDSDGNIVVDDDGNPVPEGGSDGYTVHPTVRAAVLIEIANQYRFREGEGDTRVEAHAGYGYTLSRGATALLSGLRKPTVG